MGSLCPPHKIKIYKRLLNLNSECQEAGFKSDINTGSPKKAYLLPDDFI